MPETPFPAPYRRRRPRRAKRHRPGPRLTQRLDWAIDELERWTLLLYNPDGRTELLEREDPAKIATVLHLARRAAAREAATDWPPTWPDGAQISNHDAWPLVSRALKALRLVEARWEVRAG
jgi:hypothetical protein